MQPEPVPRSIIFRLLSLSGNCFITFSIINSVSDLGINVCLSTLNSSFQKACLPTMYAIGSSLDLLSIKLI